MIIDFKLPEVGENITSGTIVKISVAVGDSVTADQTLFELETDKATIEVPSPQAGVIKEILVTDGQDVNVGQTLIKIAAGEEADTPVVPETASPPVAETPASEVSEPPPVEEAPKQELQEEPSPVTENQSPGTPASVNHAEPEAARASSIDVPASPSVRRLARELGVNVSQVSGTGANGIITEDDVKAFVKKVLTRGAAQSSLETTAQKALPDFSKWGSVERKVMSKIRLKTAGHLSYAWSVIPHVTQFDKVDITTLEELRKKNTKPEAKLTITPFLLKVIASALKIFPQFNASVDMLTQEIIYKKYYHIGVAVDTEHGLLVPVIRDVDKKSIFQINDELTSLAKKAHDKKLTLEDMRGGTFTITNLGGIGGTSFTPLINAPEVAILGISRARKEPRYADGRGACFPSLMLPLSLSYDHRVIDGADGARFLKWITEAIQQPFMLEL